MQPDPHAPTSGHTDHQHHHHPQPDVDVHRHRGHADATAGTAAARVKPGGKDVEYTCPMHPQVRQMDPGN